MNNRMKQHPFPIEIGHDERNDITMKVIWVDILSQTHIYLIIFISRWFHAANFRSKLC